MKNLSIILNAVLLVAVIVLFVLHFQGNNSNSNEEQNTTVSPQDVKATKLCYVNTDSLLFNYGLAKELNEAFLKKQEERMVELNSKAKTLEKEFAEFQRKVQNNGFLTEARAIEARDQLIQKEQQLKDLQQKMQEEAAREQMEMSRKIYDIITDFVAEYNKTYNYDIVLGVTGGTVLYSGKGIDITENVLTELNVRYNESKK